MIYGWTRKYGLPVLLCDPAPELGPYYNQRFLLGLMPRVVKWWPTNWAVMPIVWLISFAVTVMEIFRAQWWQK